MRVVVVRTDEEEAGFLGAWVGTGEGTRMVDEDKTADKGVMEDVYVYVRVLTVSCSKPPIVPFQTTLQDSVLNEFGTWSQKWSWESRTKKP
jgi:hypothetical protein